MRRRAVVAVAALIAVTALAGLPAPSTSTVPTTARVVPAAAFTQVPVPVGPSAGPSAAEPEADLLAAGFLGDATPLVEPGAAPSGPTSRPRTALPTVRATADWKPPRYTLSGQATFYDNGTTAMRLPRGTVVRICGAGGCVLRTVEDYGPQSPRRIVDLYRPDFFAICGCASWSGITQVTVSVY